MKVADQISTDWADDGEIDFYGGMRFLWNARYPLTAGTLAVALLAFVGTRFMERTYTAVSSVVVVDVPVGSALSPEPIGLLGVKSLAESTAVRLAVVSAVTKQQPAVRETDLSRFSAGVYTTGDPRRPFLPVMDLKVTARTAELARLAADTWASVLVREVATIEAATGTATLDAVTAKYKEASDRLLARERAIRQKQRQAGKDGGGQAAMAAEQRELDNDWADLRTIGARISEARILHDARVPVARMGTQAQLPQTPSVPDARGIVAMAALAGFFGSVLVIWFVSRLRADPTRSSGPR